MYRKRWTVKALRMDLWYGGNGGDGWYAKALAKIICVFFFSILLHDEAVRSTRLIEADNDRIQEYATPDPNPYFDTTRASNVTGLVGKTIQLVCKVKNLGNRTVSWVRHRDIHLLTVGRYTYTSDQRFEAMHTPHTEEWTLRIRYAQKKDSGIYECQISTTPPIGYSVYLTVVEPVTEIAGGPDLFINKDSTINLTCLVRYAPEPPSTIVWMHDREAINFDSPRGGISLVTEKGPVTSSRLLIQKAIERDAGQYTCSPSNTLSSSVHVHIVDEHPAAMHHGSGDRMAATLLTLILLLFTII
ncbi:zwei Ig domain protein zig-8 [Apis mellifera caucasica]|uniref:Zwei Ig domain protein zig-8 n=1 Tax=Apis mellifera TaxID=7460 RepID=A0A7M7LN91_APIME|nr:zwei Ig domain protein zig-8 [Apis mellifera]KAG6796613.1 zwei Ig domain protein zig-8 [Apis mellifera caucasica]KAG9436377.1 zwei Ig domain protein zig-8 [Apis mellifera carnica]|eukprot:XP_003251584.1 zwei Ig domain protein zig-8 [Apis mellifera]